MLRAGPLSHAISAAGTHAIAQTRHGGLRNVMRRLLFIPLMLAGACISTACTTTATDVAKFNAATADVPGYALDAEYRIGAEDEIQISVWRNPDLSIKVPVRPDGKISMPLIGDVQAGGLTPSQVAQDIRQRLSRYVRDPQVSVIITQLRSHEYLSRVRVTGAVRQQVSLPFRQGMTVLDAVLAAGGINEFAAAGRTKLYRKVGTRTEVLDINLSGILNEGDLTTNVVLKPGDVITVPERLF